MNKMATVDIGKLMLSMGIPMILSMVLQAFYNIVDSAFVSNMPGTGEAALNALTLAFPVQMLMVAIGIGTGVGTNALLSKSLGQGNTEKVNKTSGNSLFLGLVIYIVFFLFGCFGINIYVSSQTSNPQIHQMAVEYLRICCLLSFGIVFFSIFEKLLQATGRSIYSTIAQALMSLMTYGLNIILGRIDESVVTAYGLYYKIQQFILFAAFGLRDAITPIVSFNHGMRSKSRVKSGIKYGMAYTLIIMAVGMVALELFAVPFSAVFGLSGTTQNLCISAMRMISLSFLFAGANVAYQGIFQALDSGIESLIISICRQFLFVLPVAWFFSLFIHESMDNIWLVWLTFPIAEIVSAVIASIFMVRINKTKIKELEG